MLGRRLFGVARESGKCMQQAVPLLAIVVPTANGLHSLQRSGTHAPAKLGIIRQLLQTLGESAGIAIGNDKTLHAITE